MPATKVKLSEFAADLNLSAQEVADQLKAMDDKVRKTTAALTDAEMNYLLEYYTQRNQVENFDAYFADRSEQAQPQPAKKPKRAAKPEQVARPKKQDAKPEAKQETAPKAKSAQPEKKQEETTAPAAAAKTAEPARGHYRYTIRRCLVRVGYHLEPWPA